MKITIGWLYPDLMSIYGDRGNIMALTKRLEWRGIDTAVKRIVVGTATAEMESCDLLFMGGAQDRQQRIAAEDLRKRSRVISDMVERGVPGLYICGAFQFLGEYYKEADGNVIEGLGIFDLHTINPGSGKKRLVGDIVTEISPELPIQNSWLSNERTGLLRGSSLTHRKDRFYLVGFENHGGRTYLGKKIRPLGKVVSGYGNNGEDKTEGAIYNNSFGSYLHGPILPKNPHFADYLIQKALEVKYNENVVLKPLDDTLEKKAHMLIAKRLSIAI